MPRYQITDLPNGLTRVYDRWTGLDGLYNTETGLVRSGALKPRYLSAFIGL